MRFTHLKLGHWRNFVSVDVPLAQRAFIVGPNASGKSNLLDALRFLRDVARPAGGLRSAIDERGGIGRVRSLHAGLRRGRGLARGYSSPSMPMLLEVRMEIDGKPWRYSLAIDDVPEDVTVVSEEVDGRKVPSFGARTRMTGKIPSASRRHIWSRSAPTGRSESSSKRWRPWSTPISSPSSSASREGDPLATPVGAIRMGTICSNRSGPSPTTSAQGDSRSCKVSSRR